MTSRDLVESVEGGDATRFDTMGEGYVYLYLRHHADKKGTVRLGMTELAAMLGVTRQTIVKHFATLTEKRLLSRSGHGRYVVRAEPMTLLEAAKKYRATLKPGDEWDAWDLAEIMWGERFPADTMDPRLNEALAYTEMLEKAGRLHYDEMNSVHTVARQEPPA